jgi:hypothetical protein
VLLSGELERADARIAELEGRLAVSAERMDRLASAGVRWCEGCDAPLGLEEDDTVQDEDEGVSWCVDCHVDGPAISPATPHTGESPEDVQGVCECTGSGFAPSHVHNYCARCDRPPPPTPEPSAPEQAAREVGLTSEDRDGE